MLRYYESMGASKSKLIMGIPFYGQSFTLQSTSAGYGAGASGPGISGKWTKQRGMLAFYEICTKGIQCSIINHHSYVTCYIHSPIDQFCD